MASNKKVLLGVGGGHYVPRHMDIILYVASTLQLVSRSLDTFFFYNHHRMCKIRLYVFVMFVTIDCATPSD